MPTLCVCQILVPIGFTPSRFTIFASPLQSVIDFLRLTGRACARQDGKKAYRVCTRKDQLVHVDRV